MWDIVSVCGTWDWGQRCGGSPAQSWANVHWIISWRLNPLFHLQLESLNRELPSFGIKSQQHMRGVNIGSLLVFKWRLNLQLKLVVREKWFDSRLNGTFSPCLFSAPCQMLPRLFLWMEPLCVICSKMNSNIQGFHQPGSQTSRPISYSCLVSESLAKLFNNQPIVTICLIRGFLIGKLLQNLSTRGEPNDPSIWKGKTLNMEL